MPRRLSLAAGIGAAIAFAASVGASAAAELIAPDTTSFTLDNGLEVVVVEDHRAPVAYHLVLYKVGAADEPPGKSADDPTGQRPGRSHQDPRSAGGVDIAWGFGGHQQTHRRRNGAIVLFTVLE